jgi:hypothetical protein
MNALESEGYATVQDLLSISYKDLKRSPNIGQATIHEIDQLITNYMIKIGRGHLLSAKNTEIELRDQFAMRAMQSLLLVYDREISEGGTGFDVCPRAYRIADKMMEARK